MIGMGPDCCCCVGHSAVFHLTWSSCSFPNIGNSRSVLRYWGAGRVSIDCYHHRVNCGSESLVWPQHALTALLATYVRYAGLPSDVQLYSHTMLNSMSFLGRVIPATDLVSRFNVLLSLVTVTLIIMAVAWLPSGSRDQATLYVVGIFGSGSGAWISLAPVCAAQLCRTITGGSTGRSTALRRSGCC